MKTLTVVLMLWASSLAADEAKAKPCAAPEHRQFDFWAGDWDTFETNDAKTVVARGRVEAILGGCVLHEVYEGADGLTGESFSIYDAARKLWSHTWVTNRGQLVVLEGHLEGDRMVLAGSELTSGGKTHLRAVWRVADGGVRETAEVSADQGRTWKPLFDIVFRRHAPSSAPASR
jgi:Protein of unknown function (DUF1579)